MRPEAPGLDRIRTLVTDHSKVAPIARLLGARVLSVEAGRVLVEFAVKPEFMHPGKVVQGGIVTAYGDVCMALAAHTLFDHGEFLSTSSITVNFLAPVTEGPVLGEGAVTRRGTLDRLSRGRAPQRRRHRVRPRQLRGRRQAAPEVARRRPRQAARRLLHLR